MTVPEQGSWGGTLEAALDYHRRGWNVIPVPVGKKNPGREGWEREQHDEAEIRAHFEGVPRNVGVVLGEASGDLVDGDLDVPEAARLADAFLPETGAVFGRASKPRSHRLYYAPGAATLRFQDIGGEVLLELRSNGAQTIFPPSAHVSGERVGWVGDGPPEPARVETEDLERACRELATATLVARHLPEGGRHDFAMALFGFLLRSGRLDEETALKIATAAWDCTGYPDGKSRSEAHRDLASLVRDTTDALENDAEVRGGPTLDEHVPGLPKAIAGIWDWKTGKKGEEDPKQTELLLGLAGQAALFCDKGSEPYATIPVGGHRETHHLHSKRFKNWMRFRYYEEHGKNPNAQVLRDTLGLLEGQAMFGGAVHEVHVRLAAHAGRVYLDLCNGDWEVVEVAPDGWRVMPGEEAPVRFRRAKGMLPLPHPHKDGDLSGLRRLLNLPEDDERSWVMILSWLVAALSPQGPFPILILQGEQGSAKSTAGRILRGLVDPSTAPLRTTPRDERDLAITADSSWVVAFDNLSGFAPWLSDALCRLSTGGGFSTRTLYENREQEIFESTRPQMLNGISGVATRPDLVDRSLIVELPTIPEEKRKTERDLWDQYDRVRPAALGALLDAVAVAMRRFPETKLERLPRMADFALWAVAAERGFGWEDGTFMRVYEEAREEAVGEALEGDPVAEAVLAFMADKREWAGTADELRKLLNRATEESVQRGKAWPKHAAHLSGRLKRLAPALRARGLVWEEEIAGDKKKTRKKRLAWRANSGPTEEEVAAAEARRKEEGDGVIPFGL